MLRHIGTSLVATLALTCSAAGQGFAAPDRCDVYVQVAFPNGTALPMGTRIVLTDDATGVPTPLFTNRDGGARISLAPGAYAVQIVSKDIELDSATASFRVYPGETAHNEYVTVRQKSNVGGTRPTSANALQVPENARGYFDKAMRDLRENKNGSATKNLKRAIEIFPQYAEALNALGVLAGRENNAAKAEKYFREAVQADGSSIVALVNLARIYFQQHQYETGEHLVQRAVQLDPRNPEALSLLAYFALVQKHFDDAIEVARRVHGMDHQRYALVHFVAANAYEQKQLHQEAAEEYKQYLEESPNGPGAAQARSALTSMRASIR